MKRYGLTAFYHLRRSKKVLRKLDRLYQRKWKVLDHHAKEKIIAHLDSLREALKAKNAPEAKIRARELQEAAHQYMPQTAFEKVRHAVGGLGFALLVAIVIRQMWFELYTIPTGSMRPTLKESDFLVVSKTDFSVNVPLSTTHFMFDDSLVKRGSIVVWTGANMDIPDSDTVYFYLFPGKKLFVKRLMGKPGDTLYFYGGKIYGIDKNGNDLAELRKSDWSQNLEHVPFIRFEGTVDTKDLQGQMFMTSVFQQMNLPVAKLKTNVFGTIKGEMLGGLEHYSDLWGMKNYAMARLLNQEQLASMYPGAVPENGLLYLELTHHPSLKHGKLVKDRMHRVRPDLATTVSLIPLQKDHLHTIANSLTTCRFTVENGKAFHIGSQKNHPFFSRYFPTLENVPNGTYEIQNGKAVRIYPLGITKELAANHPLYNKDPSFVQKLYNFGIEFLTFYEPAKNSTLYPSRYAYFRDGSLYLMGSSILERNDPALVAFNEKEQGRIDAFIDQGAPLLADGSLDKEFIRKYGVVVPEKMYLMLGDNHAMSADSRQFGFVPQDNLKGVLSFLFSPPGSRFGKLPQPEKNQLTFPTIFVWGSAMVIIAGYLVYRRKKQSHKL
ncbi:MAG TPA: signal peptidase I [Chlamydiales bacterium]|nr:signal peptidase I [Chlamydiales bacterium]